MAIEQCVVRVTTTGGDGSATGSAYSPAINGYLIDIDVNLHASAPATTDVTISEEGRTGNLWARSDSAADALVAPRAKPVDNANAAITNAHDKFSINGRILCSVAGANALTNCLVATIRYETT